MVHSIELRGLGIAGESRHYHLNLDLMVNKGDVVGVYVDDLHLQQLLALVLRAQVLPDRGEIFVAGLNALKHSRLVSERVGWVPFGSALMAEWTLRDNLHWGISTFTARRQSQARMQRLVEYFEIEDQLQMYPHEVSVASQYAVSMSRALISEPEVIIVQDFSERTGASIFGKLWRSFSQIISDDQTVVLISSHLNNLINCTQAGTLTHLGKDMLSGVWQSLLTKYCGARVMEISLSPEEHQYLQSRMTIPQWLKVDANRYLVFDVHADLEKQILLQARPHYYQLRPPNLSDLFSLASKPGGLAQ